MLMCLISFAICEVFGIIVHGLFDAPCIIVYGLLKDFNQHNIHVEGSTFIDTIDTIYGIYER